MAGEDYRQASFDVWQRMAAGWDRERQWMWDVSRVIGEWMVDALDPQPGQTILELASGAGQTGFAAAAVLGDEGRLISTDFAPKMVDAARAGSEQLGLRNVQHRQLDAENMDLEDNSVDGVLCRWGYMLMGDPQEALHETRRVLREGGALSMSVLAAPAGNPWATVPGGALRELTGTPPPDPTAPGLFAMADPDRTRSMLETAGFEVKRMEDVGMTWRFERFEEYWTFLTEVAGAVAVVIAGLPEEQQRILRDRIQQASEPYRANGGYAFPGLSQNTLAA
jgi:ubiquinone/menaquinone biosynthesis C-methylase UbiE